METASINIGTTDYQRLADRYGTLGPGLSGRCSFSRRSVGVFG